jgi:hypothetical protein
MQGRAAFLAPLIRTVPSRGLPPRITSLSIVRKSLKSKSYAIESVEIESLEIERRFYSIHDCKTTVTKNMKSTFVGNRDKPTATG